MPLLEEEPSFTGNSEVFTFAGILFDMDGTIVDSTDAIVKHWYVVPNGVFQFHTDCEPKESLSESPLTCMSL